jgi:hypothetical protein
MTPHLQAPTEVVTKMVQSNRSFMTWDGEKNRTLKMYRPCDCGCDRARFGYLSGSDDKGNGLTIYAKSEKQYQAMRKIFGGAV